MSNLQQYSQQIANEADTYFGQWISSNQFSNPNLVPLVKESVAHSFLGGGKRFRPVLVILTGEMLGLSRQQLWPFALAVEMIHTYSLIHDDLPCMDNDDLRRGRPTNHKVFGEDIALLAGDLLLTESFGVPVAAYGSQPQLALELVRLMVEAAGGLGMVNGQILDILAQKNKPALAQLELLHSQKTGALIRLCVEGAAVIANASPTDRRQLRLFGEHLGMAFQIADDILDHNEAELENCSFTSFMSVQAVEQRLQQTSQMAIDCITGWGDRAKNLKELVQFNLNRKA